MLHNKLYNGTERYDYCHDQKKLFSIIVYTVYTVYTVKAFQITLYHL